MTRELDSVLDHPFIRYRLKSVGSTQPFIFPKFDSIFQPPIYLLAWICTVVGTFIRKRCYVATGEMFTFKLKNHRFGYHNTRLCGIRVISRLHFEQLLELLRVIPCWDGRDFYSSMVYHIIGASSGDSTWDSRQRIPLEDDRNMVHRHPTCHRLLLPTIVEPLPLKTNPPMPNDKMVCLI